MTREVCGNCGVYGAAVRTVERVTFHICPECEGMKVEVDGVPVSGVAELIERVGGEDELARIGALLRGEEAP